MLLSAAAAYAETPHRHIRVIMDTSLSLRQNDPSGYVKLATALFYELAMGTSDNPDTFKLAFFHPSWSDWKATGKAPSPITPELVLTADHDPSTREAFVKRILSTPYDAKMTYFSPGFQWALSDLRASGTGTKDNRAIVLITDGVPDWKEADGDALGALSVEIKKEGIKVYVLAFSKEVNQNSGWFNKALQLGPLDVKERPDANNLLSDILEIFSRSFGFSYEPLGAAPGKIDVVSNINPRRAAVVAVYPAAGAVGFEIKPPQGPAVTQERRETSSPLSGKDVHPVSYAFKWLSPAWKGFYDFRATGPAPSAVAILRSIDVVAEVTGVNGEQINAVMADKPAEMQVLVRSTAGGSNDPGSNIRIGYYLRYFDEDDRSNPNLFSERDDPGTPTSEGRVFRIQPRFVASPLYHGQPFKGDRYPAFIELVVLQNGVPVELGGRRPHQVTVYPYVSISPYPNNRPAEMAGGKDILSAGDEGCVTFQFQGNKNGLTRDSYRMGIRTAEPFRMDGPFRGARFRMDGQELRDGRWQANINFDPRRLGMDSHQLCVSVGRPTSGTERTVPFHFGLQIAGTSDPYYEQLRAVDPDLSIQIHIAEPDFMQVWKPWLLLLLTMLLMSLFYLFLRNRRLLPPDLAVSLADTEGYLTRAKLGEGSFGSRWLGLTETRPIISLTGDKELGSVRPVTEELFLFLPARGFGLVMEEADGVWRPVEARGDGAFSLQAGRRYRAGTGKDTRFFRLDYSESRPKV
jgi:hypothetical protein